MRFFSKLCGLLLCALIANVAVALPVPDPPQLNAGGYLLMDFHSGQVLVEFNADERLEPASLTKIMTAYIVFRELRDGNLQLDEEVLVSEKAWRTGGSKMFIEVGKRVKVEDLIQGMIVQSGNDASVALAEHIAGSEAAFAEFMNVQARALGMNHSNFTNSTGLPGDNHYTTARDVAILTRALIDNFPDYYRWYSQPYFTYNDIQQHNRNRLLRQDPSVDGVKTGYTRAAGYCLVSSALRNSQRLISVVMKTESVAARTRDSLALLNYGFRFFETHRLASPGQPLEQIRVWKGEDKELPVGAAEELYVTIGRGRFDGLSLQLERQPQLEAPIEQGTTVGEIVVMLGDEEILRAPLVALQTVRQGNLLRQFSDTILQWF